MKLVKQVAVVWIQFREFQAALAAFRRLLDHDLSKAGWARGDIVRLAFKEPERRTAAHHRDCGQVQVDALRAHLEREATILRS